MTAPEPREDVLIGSADVSVSFPAERDTAVAEVLAAHAKTERFTKGARRGVVEWFTRCICGEELPWEDSGAHRAHVAEALAPLIAERERAAVVEAWDEGWWKGRQDRDPTVLGYAENPYRGGGK